MAGHFITDNDGKTRMHITLADIYRYRGFHFEFHPYCGVNKVRASDYSHTPRMGRKFWKAVEAWLKLPPSKRERTRVFG